MDTNSTAFNTMMTESPDEKEIVSTVKSTSSLLTRFVALATLTAAVAGVAYIGHQGYRAATDAFVAPIILSPDNDIVLANKVKLSELQVERMKTASEADAIDADLAAGEDAITRLKALRATATESLSWIKDANARQASAGAVDLKLLGTQRLVLQQMSEKQQYLAQQMDSNSKVGLVSKSDSVKDAQALEQLRLAMLDNERTSLQTRTQMEEVAFAQKSIAGGRTPPMPEVLLREDQVVRIELDLLKLETEQRAKTVEKRLASDKLAKIDEIETQLKARPMFRAGDHSIDVAFVPYTQIEGMREGDDVYDCTWGLFFCKQVGRIAELVPGEVILPDPWGTQSRGQYAMLNLREHESAKSKTLRVRPPPTPYTPVPREADSHVSVK